MNTHFDSPSGDRSRARRAFTILELLVVLGVVTLLLVLHLSALASAKDQTLRAQCVGNLRQVTLTTQILSSENSDKLPVNTAGNWAWDMSWQVGNMYTQYINLQTLYCPASGFNYDDNARLWVYAFGAIHVVGYAQTFPGTADMNATNLNAALTPQRIPNGPGFLPAPSASQRVLFADAVMTSYGQTDPSQAATYNWTNIAGAYPKHHRTAHMDGALPAGGNLGMLDGHVEWRPFSQMQPRSSNVSGAPIFWW